MIDSKQSKMKINWRHHINSYLWICISWCLLMLIIGSLIRSVSCRQSLSFDSVRRRRTSRQHTSNFFNFNFERRRRAHSRLLECRMWFSIFIITLFAFWFSNLDTALLFYIFVFDLEQFCSFFLFCLNFSLSTLLALEANNVGRKKINDVKSKQGEEQKKVWTLCLLMYGFSANVKLLEIEQR